MRSALRPWTITEVTGDVARETTPMLPKLSSDDQTTPSVAKHHWGHREVVPTKVQGYFPRHIRYWRVWLHPSSVGFYRGTCSSEYPKKELWSTVIGSYTTHLINIYGASLKPTTKSPLCCCPSLGQPTPLFLWSDGFVLLNKLLLKFLCFFPSRRKELSVLIWVFQGNRTNWMHICLNGISKISFHIAYWNPRVTHRTWQRLRIQ